MARFKQGFFKPKNQNKYLGDISKIYYRSSWELKFMNWCDLHTGVLKWNSEGIVINYIKPTDQQQHRYFVDFFFRVSK